MSARADDQQAGAASLLGEYLRWLTHAHCSFDIDAVCLFAERGECRTASAARGETGTQQAAGTAGLPGCSAGTITTRTGTAGKARPAWR